MASMWGELPPVQLLTSSTWIDFRNHIFFKLKLKLIKCRQFDIDSRSCEFNKPSSMDLIGWKMNVS